MEHSLFLPLDSVCPGDAVVRSEDHQWWLFQNPRDIILATQLDQVQGVLNQAEAFADSGGYAVGFVAYEAAPAFESRIAVRSSEWPILAWFALYDSQPTIYPELEPVDESHIQIGEIPSQATYRRAFDRVKEGLADGAIYQANLTFKLPIESSQPPVQLFSTLCGTTPPPYATFIHGGDWQIVSLSPELFFSREGTQVEMRPMKGTAPNPATREDRQQVAQNLIADPKTIAENIMIVDMVRNDLGRIATPGSIQTPALLTVEEHRTVLQVTSTVVAEVAGSTESIFQNAFPPASVTGAPKISACGYLAELEASPRDVYCGAIGYFGPDRVARFSVGIRTARFWGTEGKGEYGVGSGVVWDSVCDTEYEECLTKSQVLRNPAPSWALLESISDMATDEEICQHLDRMEKTAQFYGMAFPREEIRLVLNKPLAPKEKGAGKLRLTLSTNGTVHLDHQVSVFPLGKLTVRLANRPMDSSDLRYRHKTTSRSHLNSFLTQSKGADDVLLFNERGEITSFCNGNVILELQGAWVTPPVESGCLPGIGVWKFRQKEKVITRPVQFAEIGSATRILLSNAVVGVREVELTLD